MKRDGAYQDVKVWCASTLILYDAIVMSAFSEHAAFEDGSDDRSDYVVEIVDHSEGIGQHQSHPL